MHNKIVLFRLQLIRKLKQYADFPELICKGPSFPDKFVELKQGLKQTRSLSSPKLVAKFPKHTQD